MIEYVLQAFKKYFIPQTGNDNKPHILRPRAIAFFFIVMLVAESAFVLGSPYVRRSQFFGLIEATALVDETNQQRTAQGFATLQVSPLLQQAAQDKANDMAANSYFAHTSPSGVTPWDWFEKAGYQFSYAGENLAVDFSNSQDVTNAWMNSPEHRANIMNSNFTQIGMATAQGTLNGQPAIFVVEEFGTPASAPLAFINSAAAATIANPAPTPTPAPVTVTPPATPTKPITMPAPKPKPKPIAVAPIPSPMPGTIVVASASVENSTSQQLFVAVKGVETQTVPKAVAATATSGATTTASAPVVAAATATAATAAAAPTAATDDVQEPNSFQGALQWLVSNPRAVANDFYIFLIALFVIASILNFFIKIRIQFPKLVLGGMTVVIIAGLCVFMNQSVGLLGAAII